MAAAGRCWGERGSAVVQLPRTPRMVSVEYPGLVRDVGAVLRTLGGEEGVSRIYADPAKRLELCFRPKDPYCHPVCANRFPTSTMLLRVRRRTRRNKTQVDTEEPVQPEVRFEMEIVGIVTTVYKFQGMSDFQYLAMHSGPDGKQTSMYDKVLMLKPEKEEFFNRELPLYIPPPIFSRLDTPVDYFYRPDTQHRDGYNNPQVSGENLIGLSRARRPHNAIFLNFDEEEVPTKPLDAAVQTWKKVCTNAVDRKVEEELRKLFEIRPVWSRNAVKANVNIHPDKLKLLLPYLAYYMLGVVRTEGGFVEGENKQLGLFGNYIDIFRGIPFAAPPNILEDPKPHPGWQGTLKATEFQNCCMQTTLEQNDVRGKEDCLYLNIWIPQGKKEVSTNLPVMVWIYGGAFLIGEAEGTNFRNNYLYDGEEIAVRGNVIVVTLNYRVGPLGFLSTGDSNMPGNYGLKDQHMAIAWVKRNIKAFGGDPDNITIFGESAGATSVSLQILSPKNAGLFKRAISQSGVSLCSWAIQKDPLYWAKKVGQQVGCPTSDTKALANCLRASDPKAVTLAYKQQLVNLASPLVHTLAITPVIDGDFLPDVPEKLFANAADIDYIAGVNDMDGHFFAGIDIPAINSPLVKITASNVYDFVKGLTADRGERGAKLTYDIYTELWGNNPDQEVMKRTVVDLSTDYIFLIPTQWTLNLHLRNARRGKTYSYVFSEPSRMPIYPSWVGADHADDLQYVFGKPFATPLGYLPKHRTLSAAMIAYWTNFARTGDPNTGYSEVPVTWLPYTTEGGYYLDINSNLNYDSVKQNLRSPFVNYWNAVYLKLPQVATTQ